MDNLSMDAETKKELLKEYAFATSEMRFIKNGYSSQLTSASNEGAEIAYLVSFVHPEVSPIYQELIAVADKEGNLHNRYEGGRPYGFPKENKGMLPGMTFDTLHSELSPSDVPVSPDAHPLCSMLDSIYGGVLLHVMEGERKGETETAYSNRLMNNKFIDIYNSYTDAKNTTAGFIKLACNNLRKIIDDKKSSPEEIKVAAAKLSNIGRIEKAIDYSSLFGYKLPKDTEPMVKDGFHFKPATDKQWERLIMCEHIFYSTVLNTKHDEHPDSDISLDTANSVFAFTVKLGDFIYSSPGNAAQRMLSTLDNVLSGSIQEQANDNAIAGELNKRHNIGQLAAFLALAPDIPCGPKALPLIGENNDSSYAMTLLRNSGVDEKELAEYANVINELRKFKVASAGEKRKYKVGPSKWSVNLISEVIGKLASGEYSDTSSDAQIAANEIYRNIIVPIGGSQNNSKNSSNNSWALLSDSVRALPTNLAKHMSGGTYWHPLKMVILIGNILNSMGPDSSTGGLVAGLTPDASGDTGGKSLAEIANEVGTKANTVKPLTLKELSAANDLLGPAELANATVTDMTTEKSTNPLQWTGQEMTVIDPAADDVSNALVAPARVIPLFCSSMQFPGSDISALDAAMYKDAIALSTYMVIRGTEMGSENVRIELIDSFKNVFPDKPTVTTDETAESENLPLQDIPVKVNIDNVVKAVEDYLQRLTLVSSDVGNAIAIRNKLIDSIQSPYWNDIAERVLACVRGRHKPASLEALAEFNATYDIQWMETVRAYVLRYVFEVKKGSGTVKLDSSLSMADALPLEVINKSEYGRLRLTGGAEDSITDAGKDVLKYMHGIVKNSATDNDGESAYRIQFESGNIRRTYSLNGNETEHWIYPQAVVMVDPGDSTPCYAVWQGIRFIAVKSMESGPSNTYRKSDEYYGLSNDVHMTDNTGSAQTTRMVPSVNQFVRAMGTASPRMIAEISDLNKSMSEAGVDINQFDAIAKVLTFMNNERPSKRLTRSQIADVIPETLWDDLKLSKLLTDDLGTSAINATRLISDALLSNVSKYSSDKGYATNCNTVRTLELLLEWVKRKPGDDDYRVHGERMMRILRAFSVAAEDINHRPGIRYPFVIANPTELNDIEFHENYLFDKEGNVVKDAQGQPRLRRIRNDVHNTEIDQDHVFHPIANRGIVYTERDYPGIDEVASKAHDVYIRYNDWLNENNFATPVLATHDKIVEFGRLYDEGIDVIKSLLRVHLARLRSSIPEDAKTKSDNDRAAYDVLVDYMDNVVFSSDSSMAMKKILEVIEPYAENNPLIMQRSLGDILVAMDSARAIPREMKLSRHQYTDYNKGYGRSDPRRVTGHENDELLGGAEENEIDRMTGDMAFMANEDAVPVASDSIDEDALWNLPETARDFEGATSCEMLGHVMLDTESYRPGTDVLRLDRGISPAEFKKLAAAIDSAHEEYAELSEYAPKGNAAISAYEKNTDVHDTITRIVEGFYNFMVSGTPIYNRNIKDEATAIKNYIDSVVAKANVPMVSKAIEEARDYFGQLVNGLNSRDEVEGYGNDVLYDDAHRLATAAANIILKLDTYQRTELVSDKTNGLGKFSDLEHRPSAMDDKYALSGMLTNVASDGSNRIVTDETKNARKNVFSSHITDLGQRKEYAETLASIYNTLGMGDTMGFWGALIPEQDILSKLENKAIKETRKLYNDVIDNDLSAAFVYMLMDDERANNARYGKVSWFIKKLLGQVDDDGQLHAIDLPEYVFSGVGRAGDTDAVRVTFNKDGSRTTDEVVPPFVDMVEISLATGEFVPAAGGDTTEVTPEMVMSVVNAIRTTVIGRMLEKNPTLAKLKKLDSDTAKPIYRDRVEAFEKAIYASAGKPLGQQGYMPLSLLYGCVDYGAVEDAMKAIADSSDVALKNRHLAAQSNAIMKRIFGNHYSDAPLVDDYTMQGMVPERLKSVLKVALPEMCKTGEARSIKTSRALNAKDDTGTNLISLFKGQRDAANEFITMCMDQIPMENAGGLGADEISEIADNIVDKIFAVHSSTENSEWFNDIANAMAKSVTGEESRDATITEIGKIINPSGNMDDVAERILSEYEDAIRTYRDEGKVINKSVCKNLAIDVLDRIYNRDSAFRREYIQQHGSPEADDVQAYINMHGNSPITDANYIRTAEGEIGGASVLHQKVYGILAKNNQDDAEMLKDLQFSIGKATGGAALDKFNELVADLCDKLDALYTSTIKFAKASLGAKTPKAVMAIASNKIGDNPRDMVHAGHDRKTHLKVLESTIQYIKEFLSYSKPKDKVFDLYSANVRDNVSGVASWENNPIDAFVNIFLNTFCDISQSESREAIAQWDAKFGNKKDAKVKEILDKFFRKLRKLMAREFAYDSSMYARGAESLANAAGGARGVYTPDVNETDQEIIRLIDKFSKISYFPIKLNRHDSDVLPEKSQEYLIEGNDATREEAIAVMKSAMQKYFEETGETDFNKADINIDEFIECVNQSTSFKPEVQMGTEGITRLLINTMKARNLIKISPISGCVRIKRKADISNVGKKKDGCIFDIPAGILYSIVDDALRDTRFTGSGNEWEAFSRELSRLTLKGARELDKQLGESNFQNQLIKLFRSVNDTRLPNLLNKVVESLTDEERTRLLNNGAVTTPEGIRMALTSDAVDNPKFGDDEDNRIALLWKNPDAGVDYDVPDEPPAPPAEPHGQPVENPGDVQGGNPEAGRNPDDEI